MNYFSPGTDPAGNVGWKVINGGIVKIVLNISFGDGTSTPTSYSGTVAIFLRYYDAVDVATYTLCGQSCPWEDTVSFGSLSDVLKFDTNDWINVFVQNNTDGDIVVTSAQLTATFERATG